MNIKEYAITEWDNVGINFWNVSKCAGTSVKHALLENSNFTSKIKNIHRDKTVHNNEFIKYITKEQAIENNNTNVAVIRHPVDRVISLYRDFSLKRKQPIPVYKRTVDENKIFDIDYFIDFYIAQGSDKDNLHLRSIAWSLCDSKKLLVDKLYTFENVNQMFEDYNLNYIHRNKSAEADISLTTQQIKQIQNRYADDYEIFGFDYV